MLCSYRLSIPVANVTYVTYARIYASLLGRSNVTEEKCVKVNVFNGTELVNITRDHCNGTILNVFWKGFGDRTKHSMLYDVYVDGKK